VNDSNCNTAKPKKVSIFGGSETLDEEKQKYHQERNGDELTKAIKVAQHNLRKEQDAKP